MARDGACGGANTSAHDPRVAITCAADVRYVTDYTGLGVYDCDVAQSPDYETALVGSQPALSDAPWGKCGPARGILVGEGKAKTKHPYLAAPLTDPPTPPAGYVLFVSADSETKNRFRANRAYQVLRAQVLTVLGEKCARCGFADKRALQVDHREGNGTRERRWRTKAGRICQSGIPTYRRVLREPEEYQLLCANCNWIKKAERRENRGKPSY